MVGGLRWREEGEVGKGPECEPSHLLVVGLGSREIDDETQGASSMVRARCGTTGKKMKYTRNGGWRRQLIPLSSIKIAVAHENMQGHVWDVTEVSGLRKSMRSGITSNMLGFFIQGLWKHQDSDEPLGIL